MKKLLIFLILTYFINCFAMHLDYSYEVQNNTTIPNIILPKIGTQGTAGSTINIPDSYYIPDIFGPKATDIIEEFIPI